MKHSEYVSIIKNTATSVASKTITTILFAEVPFLAWGPLAKLTTALVDKVITKAFDEAEMAIFFQYIDMRVDTQGRNFSALAIKNYTIQQTGTEDEKKKSEAELILAFKSFIKLSN